ncbi:metallophosphoesterase [Salinarchaeum sp. Harcht-Bsk1]|uniref:metallophosphoesterase n=1 Tax=Salinarchaeum sp. Harcht-Bsk1 TaxID=1333523 RepID=UPI0003422ECD|nr:metallophosphoesterase [Salinarchaeum sp. Harcht-Bsk1]AGN02272.1 metallophosphoesterase [Salinarchaeum sp. Harcht-Bsk1]
MTTPELADRAAYVADADALVCADLHLGRDANSNVELPMGEASRIPERVSALLDRFEPGTVVVAGDVLHAFDSVPEGVTDALVAVEEAVADAGAELLLVAGNHDGMLESVTESRVVEAADLGNGTVVIHGDEQPSALELADLDADRYVIGHEHPAIVIEGQRHACYLEGPAPDGDASVFALPAFNRLARGTVLNGSRTGDPASPLLAEIRRFRPAVRDPEADETLWFPPFSELQALL